MTTFNYTSFPRAGIARRLASWIYDFLIAIAVYMTAGAVSFLLIVLFIHFGLFGMQGHQHVSDVIANVSWLKWSNEVWKFAWVSFFFVYFWSKSGQTLGMKAWRLRLQNQDGTLISRSTGVKRLAPTLLGLGNFWLFFNWKDKLSLQDKLTDTEVVVLSLEANRGRL